jgi:uncharacterized phage-associated protein
MASVEPGGITTWKLQKLAYYSQAWSLVWDDQPLFPERIEAWANGPVCPVLYDQHKGQFKVEKLPLGNVEALTKDEKDTIGKVIEFYSGKSSQELSQLTHAEQPWITARGDLPPGERGRVVIEHDSMAEYYGGLYEVEVAAPAANAS